MTNESDKKVKQFSKYLTFYALFAEVFLELTHQHLQFIYMFGIFAQTSVSFVH